METTDSEPLPESLPFMEFFPEHPTLTFEQMQNMKRLLYRRELKYDEMQSMGPRVLGEILFLGDNVQQRTGKVNAACRRLLLRRWGSVAGTLCALFQEFLARTLGSVDDPCVYPMANHSNEEKRIRNYRMNVLRMQFILREILDQKMQKERPETM